MPSASPISAHFRLFASLSLLFTLTPSSFAQIPGYGGPGVATQGPRQPGARGADPVSIRPYASVMGIVDSGVIAVGLDSKGNITNPGALYGVEASLGAYGSRSWRRSLVGLDYQGGYRHYTSKTYFDGSEHLLSLRFAHQLDRRTSFNIRSVAGSTSRATGGTFGIGFLDPTLTGTTALDIFDNRAFFLDGMGELTRQIGSRGFLSLSGGGFAVRRQSKTLVGMNGQRASASFGRQINRKTTVSTQYQYMHVDYPRVFGEADINTVIAQVSHQLSRNWLLSLAGGAFRMDFTGIRTVQLDPVIAELFGVSSAREAFNSININPHVNISLSTAIRRGLFAVSYMRGANPGNGVLLLNRQESFAANYTYNTSSRWALSGLASVNRLAGVGAYNNRITTYGAGLMASHPLANNLHFTANFDVRQYTTGQNAFSRFGSRISAGLAFSPGDIPVSLR